MIWIAKHKRAAAFMEYAIILVVASLALVGMEVYIRRGMQGRIKNMTDIFISNEQVTVTNPTAVSSSASISHANVLANSFYFDGGSTSATTNETIDFSAGSRVVDRGTNPNPYVAQFIPSEAGFIDPPARQPVNVSLTCQNEQECRAQVNQILNPTGGSNEPAN